MKTEEEFKKIYSAYFPHDLELAYCDRDGNALKVGTLSEIQYNNSETHPLRLSIEGLYELEHVWMFKPYLWSMDMLTKEIEHKGEKLNVYSMLSESLRMQIDILDFPNYKHISVFDYEILLENHFNVFSLSDSEYIQKA